VDNNWKELLDADGNKMEFSTNEQAKDYCETVGFNFYTTRNIFSESSVSNIILSVSQAHTSIDFTIVAKNLTASKYYTINGMVTIDWTNETYKFRMINTNTNVFDDADFLLFNIVFGFNSTQFEIKADNQSTNNFYLNINANIL